VFLFLVTRANENVKLKPKKFKAFAGSCHIHAVCTWGREEETHDKREKKKEIQIPFGDENMKVG
jgi:hypothetical protein